MNSSCFHVGPCTQSCRDWYPNKTNYYPPLPDYYCPYIQPVQFYPDHEKRIQELELEIEKIKAGKRIKQLESELENLKKEQLCMNHKRKRPKVSRSGCLLCKPWKAEKNRDKARRHSERKYIETMKEEIVWTIQTQITSSVADLSRWIGGGTRQSFNKGGEEIERQVLCPSPCW